MRVCIAFLLFVQIGLSQNESLSPNAPADKPFSTDSIRWATTDRAIKPLVDSARTSYGGAKNRFHQGLPEGELFFVTIRLRDSNRRIEQVFVQVQEIVNDTLRGILSSDIHTVVGFRFGQPLTFSEMELLDWMIAKPDGSEEGNIVGKFLDTYRPEQ